MKKIRLLALVVIFGLILAIVAGCQTETTGTTGDSTTGTTGDSTTEPVARINKFGWAVPEETLVISLYHANGFFAPSEEQKQGRENMADYLLEEFNIKFDIITTDGDGMEYLNLMLASGNYPEVINNLTYDGVLRLKEADKAQDLTAAIDAHGQQVISAIGDELYPLFLDDQGKLWYVPIGVGGLMELPDFSAHVRWDEYLAIGSPKIETPDDYYDVINKILDEFPLTPAGESRYTLSLYNQGDPAGSFGGYWGLKRGWKEADDKSLTYWAFTEEGKAMSKWFNRFWTDGTMDPDAFANNFDQWKAKFSAERVVGAIGGWWIGFNAGHEVWILTDPDWHEDKRFVQVGFKAPEAKAATVTGKIRYGGWNTVVTDKAENLIDIVKLMNFQATEPGLALFNWGIPGEVPKYGSPGEYVVCWHIDDDGNWYFDEGAKQLLIEENWDYPAEGVLGGDYAILFQTTKRWADGIHCVWRNQMWYEENKWKTMMIENMKDTIYDFTPMSLREKSSDTVLTETAITDTWKQHWPLVVQAANDTEFEQRWTAFQEALSAVGIEEYTRITEENYKANLEKLGG